MIEPLTSQTQWVEHQSALVDSADFAIWRWKVLPLKSGNGKLRLDVTLRSFKDDGLTGEIPLQPSQNFEVKGWTSLWKNFPQAVVMELFLFSWGSRYVFHRRYYSSLSRKYKVCCKRLFPLSLLAQKA